MESAFAIPDSELPRVPRPRPAPEHASAAAELLKVLLKMVAEEHGVAARIIACSDDLERIAADDDADVPALKGWRRQLFGKQALALKRGELALSHVARSGVVASRTISKRAGPTPNGRPGVASRDPLSSADLDRIGEPAERRELPQPAFQPRAAQVGEVRRQHQLSLSPSRRIRVFGSTPSTAPEMR